MERPSKKEVYSIRWKYLPETLLQSFIVFVGCQVPFSRSTISNATSRISSGVFSMNPNPLDSYSEAAWKKANAVGKYFSKRQFLP